MANVTHPDIFVSYSTSDKDAVQNIVTDIRRRGYTIWIDHERVLPGEPFLLNVYSGMDASTCILLAISRDFLSSAWCRDELASAITDQVRSGKKLLPILLDDADPSGLPGILRSRRAIRLNELAASLKEILGLPRFWTFEGVQSSARLPSHFQDPDLQGLKPREITFRPAMPVGLFVDQSRERTLEGLVHELSSVNQDSGSYLILGEAGIGKTTVANYLSVTLHRRLSTANEPQVVPRLIRLGERAADDLVRALDAAIDEETVQTAEETGYPILLILDGLNEIPPHLLDTVLRTVVISAGRPLIRFLATSRPAPLVASLLELESVEFQTLRIERWTPDKVKEYFMQRGFPALYSHLSPEVADSLRLPLLASLLIRRIDESNKRPSLRTVADVFEYIVADATEHIDSESSATFNRSSTLKADARKALETLALSMTNRNTVLVPGPELLEDLSLGGEFPRALEAMVRSGLLRTVDPVAHLSASLDLEELASINFSFVHQAVQEFLTASAIRTRSSRYQEWMRYLPDEVSQDSYFRDIPVYLIELLRSSKERSDFADQFRVSGDLLTAARLVNSITDPALSHELAERITGDVRASIGLPSFYPWAREALHELGARAIHELVDFVSRPGLVEEIYSEPEARIFDLPISGADEVTWRIVGRSIVFLSEMGNSEWLEPVRRRVKNINSLHLAYHVGESLTFLAHSGLQPELVREVAGELRGCRVADAVSDAYATGVLLALGDDISVDDVSVALQQRLLEVSSSCRPHFVDEFWQRAHGVDALGIIGSAVACVTTISTVVERELSSIREGVTQVGFHTPVLSSAIQSVARCSGRFPGITLEWRSLLGQLFMSAELHDNRWLLGHIRWLLISHFQSHDDLMWLESWRSSTHVSSHVRKTIGDALWYGGR